MALAADLAIAPLSLWRAGVSSLALLAGSSSIALALSGWSVALFTAADTWPAPVPDQRGGGAEMPYVLRECRFIGYLVQMFGTRVEQARAVQMNDKRRAVSGYFVDSNVAKYSLALIVNATQT